MPRFAERLLRQEVKELTDLLRNDPAWGDLRIALAKKGFPSDEVLFAGFIEDEEWHEYGAIATGAGEVYEFERGNYPDDPPDFRKFSLVRDVGKLAPRRLCTMIGWRSRPPRWRAAGYFER